MAAISEQEEFEFRRRAELEQGAPPPKAAPAPSRAPGPSLTGSINRRGNEGLEQIARGAREWAKPDSEFGPLQGLGDIVGGGFKAVAAPISGYVERGAGPAWNAMTGGPAAAMGDFSDNMLGVLLGGPKPAPRPPLSATARAMAPKAQALGEVLAKPRAFMDAGATPAAEKVRAAALGKVLAQQRTAAEAEATAARLKAADEPLRAKMESAATAQAAKGVGVSDIPQAQSLVADLSGRLNPNGPVATTPTAGQATAYKAVIDTLAPSKGPKPSLEMVQNLRRELAETAYGGADPRGFGAISKIDKRDLIQKLHEIEDAYTGGASTPTRENWAAAMTAQEKADEMAKLKNTLGTQAAQLDKLPPKEAVTRAKAIVSSLSNKGLVPDADYREFLDLANAATTAQGKSAFRKKVALYAGSAVVSGSGFALGGHALGILP